MTTDISYPVPARVGACVMILSSFNDYSSSVSRSKRFLCVARFLVRFDDRERGRESGTKLTKAPAAPATWRESNKYTHSHTMGAKQGNKFFIQVNSEWKLMMF